MGDGGLITVNSENLKNRIIALRNHGGAVRYHHDEIGVNSRLDEIQAAILRVKLNYIDGWNKLRREHAKVYNELFASCPDIITPTELAATDCVKGYLEKGCSMAYCLNLLEKYLPVIQNREDDYAFNIIIEAKKEANIPSKEAKRMQR